MASIKAFVNYTVPTELKLRLEDGEEVTGELMGTQRAVGPTVNDDAGILLLRVDGEDREIHASEVAAHEVTGEGPIR